MAVGRRLPAARGYELEFHPLPDPLPDDPVRAARAVNAAVEAVVARCPEQYLWSYNRYKRPAGAPPPPTPPAAAPSARAGQARPAASAGTRA
jgi:KDO2-lipid IV(A) lauroyltransferase